MNGTYRTLAAGMVLALSGLIQAGPATQPAKPAARRPDYVRGLIDEYFQGSERGRFFASAGVDGEITREEFTATPAAVGFARPYDQWAVVGAFDRDRNGRLNWVEAESYRLALRIQVMKLFDKNTDGRLTGAEREAANAHLAGKARLRRPAPQPAAPPPAAPDPPLSQRPGQVRDGRGDADEYAKANLELRKQGQEWRRQWELSLWDSDGDGKLSPFEQAAMDEHLRREREKAQRRHAEWVRRWDRNADGKLSARERAEASRGMRETVARQRKEMDANGDGKLTAQEIRAYRAKLFNQLRRRRMAPDEPKH